MIKKIIRRLYDLIGSVYLNPVLKAEQKKRPFPVINERATEYAFSLKHLQKLCTGKILDIGSGKSSWPHILSICGFEVRAIDRIEGYWGSYLNRHYKVVNDDITSPETKDKFQFATCLSVLEHIPNHQLAIKNIHSLLVKNGCLILTFPYNETTYHNDIYKHSEAGYGNESTFITQVFSRQEINLWLDQTSFKIVEQEYFKVFTGEFWTFGERVTPCIKTTNDNLHHLTCLLLQKTED